MGGILPRTVSQVLRTKEIITPIITLSGAIAAQPIGQPKWGGVVKYVTFIPTAKFITAGVTIDIGYAAKSAKRSSTSDTDYIVDASTAITVNKGTVGSTIPLTVATDSTTGENARIYAGDLIVLTNTFGSCTQGSGFFIIGYVPDDVTANDGPTVALNQTTTTSTSTSTSTTGG